MNASRQATCARRSRGDVSIGRLIVRFFLDERGQDVVEYALLAAFIGAVGVLAWQGVRAGIGSAYVGWDSGIQGISDCTPDPAANGGGGC